MANAYEDSIWYSSASLCNKYTVPYSTNMYAVYVYTFMYMLAYII